MDIATYLLGNVAFWVASICAVLSSIRAFHLWSGETSRFTDDVCKQLATAMTFAACAYMTVKLIGGLL